MARVENTYVSIVIAILLVLGFLFPIHSIFAQSIPNSGGETALQVSPKFPQPHGAVTVSFDAYSLNTLGMSILWFVDGIEQISQKNERSISFTVGDVGTKHSVRSVITLPNGTSLQKTVSIPVTNVDIVVESNTYVPAFYKGRALPTEGSSIRAVALAHSKNALKPNELSYEWKVDGSVLSGGAVRGKQSITFPMPEFQDHILSVTVYDASGVALGERSVELNPAQPDVYFYEENPLSGLSRKAIDADFILVGKETTIFAEPYFMNTNLKGVIDGIEWKVDGSIVKPSGSNINALNLRHTGGEGSANINFRFVLDASPIQYVEKAFNIFFK